MFCTKCGKENRDDASFCYNCGNPMTGGPVAAPAAPAVDNEYKNLQALARRAKAANNHEQAAKYYEMLLMKDPNNWESNFYTIYFRAMGCKIRDISIAADEVSQVIKSTLPLIRDNVEHASDRRAALREIYADVKVLSNMLTRAAENHYNDISLSIRYQYEGELRNNLNYAMRMRTVLQEQVALVFIEDPEVCDTVGAEILKEALSKSLVPAAVTSALRRIDYRQKLKLAKEKELAKQAKEQEEAKKQQRIQAYWEQNPQEKEQLLAEKAQLQEQLPQLTEQINELTKALNGFEQKKKEVTPLQKENEQLREQISLLNAERAGLGIFAGKRKKEISEQIAKMDSRRSELRTLIEQEKQEVARKVNEEAGQVRKQHVEISQQKRDADKRIAQIDQLLTMDRL